MTRAPTGWSVVSRLAMGTGILAFAVGLPVALHLSGTTDRSATGALVMPVGSAISISEPLPISQGLPLTIVSGSVVSVPGERSSSGVVIDEAILKLDLSDRQAGSAPEALGPDAKPAPFPQLAGFSADTVRLTRAVVGVIAPSGAAAQLEDVNATITVSRKGSYKLVATGRLKNQPIAVDAFWSEAVTRDSAGRMPMKIVLRSPVLEALLDGHLKAQSKPQFVGLAEFQIPSLRRFALWAGLGRGVGEQFRSIAVSGPIEWTSSHMAFSKAAISVNGNHATGALTVKHGGGRLSLDGTLGFQELDLGRSWPALAARSSEEAKEPHILSMLDADLRLSATKVYAPAFEVGRAAVSIALSKGRLQADMAELDIEGGIAGGQLSLDLGQPSPKANLKLRLKGVDAGRLLAAPLRRNALLGRANITFEGTLGGRSLGEAFSTIAGRGSFDLVEPGRIGLDVNALVQAARSSGKVGWAAAGKNGTPVDTLSARYRLLDGALAIENLHARNPTSVFVGSGQLDVPARLMDVRIAIGPPSAGEAPMTVHDILLLRGTWDAPAISLHPQPKSQADAAAPVRAN
ncbi:MAG: AsmA-like C-terminal region-containing protein [Hyphomicrobiaceae bacterium]